MSLSPVESKPVGLQRSQFAAAYINVSLRTLWELTKLGKVKCVRPTPNSVRYRVEDLDAYIASLAN